MRGATRREKMVHIIWRFQSTLPMRGATIGLSIAAAPAIISIHAPHAGSDQAVRPAKSRSAEFQSTLPMRGATFAALLSRPERLISIHAPHAGSDALPLLPALPCVDFNPRSPCGERRRRKLCPRSRRYFNPRSPCGERRNPTVCVRLVGGISIHAPHAGSDICMSRIG